MLQKTQLSCVHVLRCHRVIFQEIHSDKHAASDLLEEASNTLHLYIAAGCNAILLLWNVTAGDTYRVCALSCMLMNIHLPLKVHSTHVVIVSIMDSGISFFSFWSAASMMQPFGDSGTSCACIQVYNTDLVHRVLRHK